MLYAPIEFYYFAVTLMVHVQNEIHAVLHAIKYMWYTKLFLKLFW